MQCCEWVCRGVQGWRSAEVRAASSCWSELGFEPGQGGDTPAAAPAVSQRCVGALCWRAPCGQSSCLQPAGGVESYSLPSPGRVPVRLDSICRQMDGWSNEVAPLQVLPWPASPSATLRTLRADARRLHQGGAHGLLRPLPQPAQAAACLLPAQRAAPQGDHHGYRGRGPARQVGCSGGAPGGALWEESRWQRCSWRCERVKVWEQKHQWRCSWRGELAVGSWWEQLGQGRSGGHVMVGTSIYPPTPTSTPIPLSPPHSAQAERSPFRIQRPLSHPALPACRGAPIADPVEGELVRELGRRLQLGEQQPAGAGDWVRGGD